MIYFFFLFSFFSSNFIFTQNNTYQSYNYSDYYSDYDSDYYPYYDSTNNYTDSDYYPYYDSTNNYTDSDYNTINKTAIKTNYTTINITNTNIIISPEEFTKQIQSLTPYKTLNLEKLKTKKLPILLSSEGMLKNIDGSYWLLKYYNHPNANLYKYIQIYFTNSSINIQVIDYANNIIDNNTYHLTPISMLKSNEGIFAYTDKKGDIFFIYLHLLLSHLLAIDMVSTFEEAEKSTHKSLTSLGIFVLQ